MKQMLKEQSVLVMYDIRGIQEYIFNTNKVRDIIGASLLVDGILGNGLDYCEKEYPEIKFERVYIGGGNACVIFENGQEASVINRKLALWIQQKTYSLQLAIAAVEKTESYAFDYNALQKEITKIKMQMPRTSLLGALPIVKHENSTGYPISESISKEEKVSRETYLKREKLKEFEKEKNKKFNELVDEKGKDSTLAVVHIDGNNMGKRIRHLMQDVKDYTLAKERMYQISKNITNSFSGAFDDMKAKMEKNFATIDMDRPYIRKIILAGDDITFVCTGKYAIPLVEAFIEALCSEERVLYEEYENKIQNFEANGFSVCAGIAFIHSHFPFSDAYQIAESCCQNAKRIAKQEERKEDGLVGNWIDFQICKEVQSVYLEDSREKNYRLANGEFLLKRPYYIPFMYEISEKYHAMDEKNKNYSIQNLKTQIDYLLNPESGSNLAKSDLKEMRNTYPLGSDAMDELLVFLRSRKKTLPSDAFNEQNVANWYDALEIYELYEQI